MRGLPGISRALHVATGEETEQGGYRSMHATAESYPLFFFPSPPTPPFVVLMSVYVSIHEARRPSGT